MSKSCAMIRSKTCRSKIYFKIEGKSSDWCLWSEVEETRVAFSLDKRIPSLPLWVLNLNLTNFAK